MSLLTPVKVPVKVYRSSDASAPLLDKNANCITTILKACLVTGYGAKEGAGWTLAFEDLATKTKVFNINSPTEPAIYLRLYNDTGQKMGVQLASNAVDANTVTSIVECDTVFKYLGGITTGEWMVIASNKGFWFFAPVNANAKPSNRSGVFLFAGIVPGTVSDAFVIKHTGGTYSDDDDDRFSIASRPGDAVLGFSAMSDGGMVAAAGYSVDNSKVKKGWFERIVTGNDNQSPIAIASPLYFFGMGDAYQLPIYAPSRHDLNNFDNAGTANSLNMMNFCTSTQYQDAGSNTYIPTDFWVY